MNLEWVSSNANAVVDDFGYLLKLTILIIVKSNASAANN